MTWIRGALSGMCATLVGIGLARFAYTPLIPAIVEESWFSAGEAAYLGAGNLAGYFVGALIARRIAALRSTRSVIRSALVLATLSFFASAWPSSFLWFCGWRFVAGVSGGFLMALAAPAILPAVPLDRRGRAGGIVFTGVGLGIAASGLLVPPLLTLGLTATWLGLGALAIVLSCIGWFGWPSAADGAGSDRPQGRSRLSDLRLRLLFAQYGLNAAGLVPHMVFLVDFVARGLGQGIETGSFYWVLFGLGAVVGPLLAGALGDRLGFGPAFRLALVAQAVMILILAWPVGLTWFAASSLVAGAAAPGIVPLVLGRVQELLPGDPEAQGAAWRIATMAFALGQTLGAYGLSYVFAASGDFALLFALGSGALVIALALDLIHPRSATPLKPTPNV